MGWWFFLIGWWIFYLIQLAGALFSLNATSFVLWLVLGGMTTWLINLICTAGMEGNNKPKYEEAIDPTIQKIQNNKQLNKSDLDQVLKEYNKSVNRIVADPGKSEFDLKWFTSKFQESLNLWRKIYDLMYELSWKYAYYCEKNNSQHGVWQSQVIPILSIKTRIAKWPEDSKKEIRLKHQDVDVVLHVLKDDYEKTRKLEVFQNNELVFQVDIKTQAGNIGDYGGYHEEAGLVSVFKPLKWVIALLNLANDYELEKAQVTKQISQHNKESIKKNYIV